MPFTERQPRRVLTQLVLSQLGLRPHLLTPNFVFLPSHTGQAGISGDPWEYRYDISSLWQKGTSRQEKSLAQGHLPKVTCNVEQKFAAFISRFPGQAHFHSAHSFLGLKFSFCSLSGILHFGFHQTLLFSHRRLQTTWQN